MEEDMSKTVQEVFDNMSEEKQLVMAYIVDQYKTQQSVQHSDELMHYGVIGMKWGKRRAHAKLNRTIKKMDKEHKALDKKFGPAFQDSINAYNNSIKNRNPKGVEIAYRINQSLKVEYDQKVHAIADKYAKKFYKQQATAKAADKRLDDYMKSKGDN